jgi:two-component system cell cycle sensor histidine kinase/response regulator CckA
LRGLKSEPKKGSYIKIAESVVRHVVSDKKPLLVQDIETDSRTCKPDDPEYGPSSFLSMPVFVRENVIAVLNLSDKETKQVFDSNDERILSIMIGEIGFALENAILYSKVEEHLESLQEHTVELTKANDQLQQEITERKRVEEALRESEQKYRLLVENAKDGIFIIQDGVVKFPNPITLAISGYSAEELAKIPFVKLIHPKDRDIVLEGQERILKGEEVPDTYSFRIINRTGEELWMQLNIVLIAWDGRPSTLNFIRDITQQRKLQAQLQRAQKMEAIGTLAGGVAHDLNNILSGLVSYPELLLMDIAEESPSRKPILTIQKSGEKAAAIVQDLLTLARRGVPAKEVVSLNHIISEYLKSPEYEKLQSSHPEVQVETNLETNLLNILGSPVHLSKSIMNLVSNAAESMSDGGTIFIFTENRYVDKPIRGYASVKEGDYVTLTVSDTGIGISTEDMEKIFEPFYTKKKMGRSGTGLGMAVVWGTIKDHKGYIDVQSTEGKGTTFTLYFPISRKEITKDESLASIKDYSGNGETLLLVDDVEEQREIASHMLKKLGYSVTSVASGEEAIEYMKNNSADLLILDMIMDPGIDGLETYKRLLKLHPNQKAIIASGFSETKRVKEAQKLGAGAYVKKPYIFEKIGPAIRDELDK